MRGLRKRFQETDEAGKKPVRVMRGHPRLLNSLDATVSVRIGKCYYYYILTMPFE